jgi:Ser/Thr protein kinase RdoA (MazF antagonist)
VLQPFETLSYEIQLAHLAEAARNALRSYGYPNPDVHAVAYLSNAVFEVRPPDGGHFALRLHLPGRKRLEWIKSELVWLASVHRNTSLSVPQPIFSTAGKPLVITSVEGLSDPVVCSLFQWIEGDFEQVETLSVQRVREIGRFLARLHQYAMTFDPPTGFIRPRLDEHGISSSESAYEPGAGAVLFTDEDFRTFQQVENRVRNVMRELTISQKTFGLIHADFLMKNILFKGEEVCAIDFDECSWGYYLYDLAPLMLQLKDDPRYSELRDALWEGYTADHPLSTIYRVYLETFVAARNMFSCWWLARNLHNPRIRERAPELIHYRVTELRRFLETGSISRQGDIF